ncbi:Uu.00g047750.m01.CDS01 [Anthostomella pinea]|uniref:Uu.00g047750.m01.CDS01 n=1 Tax=Anthostomella pinea TaxID=933095 RepID=A0AAI8VC44_9PEZI|nr:Uu.00g047750.m01.CDS01 [Anthostomella pinea]
MASSPPDSPGGSQAGSPESSPAPTGGQLINQSIQRLLRENREVSADEAGSQARENQDRSSLQQATDLLKEGDTLIVIRFTSGEKYIDCDGNEWTSKELRMDSQTLMATGSTVFAHLFTPEEQKKTMRRLRLGPSNLPCRFILDLTPLNEGDECAAMLMEASLPKAVMQWWMTYDRLELSPYLVLGHDDHCPHHYDVPSLCQIKPRVLAEAGEPTDLDDLVIPEPRRIADYCPMRHAACIVRLLLHLKRKDLVLNSAARMYTIAYVAQSLDCRSAIHDDVLGWLFSDPNSDFIDFHPEEALRTAWMLQSEDLARSAFRILVAERALKVLGAAADTGKDLSVFGRPSAAVTEEQATCIEHAGNSLALRVQAEVARLRSDQIYEWLHIDEWKKLKNIESALSLLQANPAPFEHYVVETAAQRKSTIKEVLRQLRSLSAALLRYMRSAVTDALLFEPVMSSFDKARKYYVPRHRFERTSTIYKGLSDTQHLMITSFWDRLASFTSRRDALDSQLTGFADEFNNVLQQAIHDNPGFVQLWEMAAIYGNEFHLAHFHEELATAMDSLCGAWSRPNMEISLLRSQHLSLALVEDEFKFLPLWAGGADDGTGAVYQQAIPDALTGVPIGPGPAFRTGETIATDISSIAQSQATATGTETVTCGHSLAAVQSTTIEHATSEVGSLPTGVDAIASQEDRHINDLSASFSVISMGDATTGAGKSLNEDVELEAALSRSLGDASCPAESSDDDDSWLMTDEDEF